MRTITEVGNDAIVQVKQNQLNLLRSCEKTAYAHQPDSAHESEDRGHGRIETRSVKVFTNLEFPQLQKKLWPSIQAIIQVYRVQYRFSTETKNYSRSDEYSYYAATYQLSALEAHDRVRAHWFIENKNHHVRDVTLREDYSRIRSNPDRFVRLRSFALNILRANGEINIAHALHENMLSLRRVLTYDFLE